MENYTLESNEVLLYKGIVTAPGSVAENELILTNLHLVFIPKADAPEQKAAIVKHPVSEIKIYREIPQIMQKNRSVEFFLTTGEITVEFKTRPEANKFMDAALELLTGKSKLARSAGKFKKALDDVNNAFGVNVLEETKNFSVDTVSRIVNNTKPSLLELLLRKNKTNTKSKEAKK